MERKQIRLMQLLGVIASFFLVHMAHAQTGTVPFSQLLYLPVDAESTGRGSTSLATMPLFSNIQNQPATLVWNIDEIAGDNTRQASLAFANRQFNGSRLSTATYSHTGIDDNGVWGFYANVRMLKTASPIFALNHSSDYRGTVVEMGGARRINDHWSGGVSVVAMDALLAGNQSGNSLGVGGSFAYDGRDEYGFGLTAGANVRNIMLPLSYSDENNNKKLLPIPGDAGIGAAMHFRTRHRNQWLLTLEAHKTLLLFSSDASQQLLEKQTQQFGPFNPTSSYTFNIGWEYKKLIGKYLQNAIVFRTGAIMDSQNDYYSGVTGGMGVIINHIQINAAYFAIPSIRNTPYGNNFTLGIAYALKGISRQ